MDPILILALAALFYAFYNFNEIIPYERENYPDAWIVDGKPSTIPSGNSASFRLILIWVFKTPSWANNDVKAKSLFSRFRWSVIVFNIGILVDMAVFLTLHT